MSALNPLIPGFHPDPSVCRVGDDYYLACSTFEYLPGIPVFHSRDLAEWTLIGHVAERASQLAVAEVPTLGGAWAPTIRHHDGRFWCVVTDAMGRGSLIFTAERPEGPWSEGTVMRGVSGIDPDIVWDEDGTCYVTYSGLQLDTSAGSATHLGIQQVRMDPETGRALEEPRSLWSGTGLMFPEAPHLYRIDGHWYLMIAEGGTERGHSVSIARSDRPDGPFEGCPANPVLSARSTERPVQNTGHGDLVRAPDGSWLMVLLGMRPRGMTRAFSAMGRETFATALRWEDGWPVVDPVTLGEPRPEFRDRDELPGPALAPEWVAIRQEPSVVGDLAGRPGWVRLTAADGETGVEGSGDSADTAMDSPRPAFLGRRQLHERASFTALFDVGRGTGGLTLRMDEFHHYDIEAGAGQVRARARIGPVRQTWERPLTGDPGSVELRIITEPVGADGLERMGPDTVRLAFRTGGDGDGDDGGRDDGPGGGWQELAALDGRYIAAETAASFTGRVAGVYAAEGVVDVDWFAYTGQDNAR
ncbi:glycoside hydrolase family 43 protein [Streptomyces paludis]|uniref:Glycoside hydrolase family 43 protein n=1 Tax=Streptomyces paludis TaxID=2282738 RepID=A0A345HLW1_9ACTN|nr:glycoside hydrolase family 43 protein [Streptomyces paludis]AXG77685.1 glycoside hydrolase family 43 protein [Streptomyces paludis]